MRQHSNLDHMASLLDSMFSTCLVSPVFDGKPAQVVFQPSNLTFLNSSRCHLLEFAKSQWGLRDRSGSVDLEPCLFQFTSQVFGELPVFWFW